MDFSSWWASKETIEQVYWCIAAPSSLIFLFLLVMTIFGGDMETELDSDVDASIEGDEGIGFQFISIKNLVAFFTIMAWSGIACINAELENYITIIISIGCGFVMMLIMASLYYFMGKMVENGTLNINNSTGKLGETYLVIPAKRDGFGKVQIKVQGALRTLDAITDDEEDIKTNSIIKVLDVIDDHILLVTKTIN